MNAKILVQNTTVASTEILDKIKNNVLEYAKLVGKGIHLDIDAIKNGSLESCKIKLTINVE
jgi:hypothetical protein